MSNKCINDTLGSINFSLALVDQFDEAVNTALEVKFLAGGHANTTAHHKDLFSSAEAVFFGYGNSKITLSNLNLSHQDRKVLFADLSSLLGIISIDFGLNKFPFFTLDLENS